MPIARPAPTAAITHARGTPATPACSARRPRNSPAATATDTTSAGVSVSGRPAVNQNSGDITATSDAKNASVGAMPTAIQNSVNTQSAAVPAIKPHTARPVAARRSRSQPGAIHPTICVETRAIAMKTG